MPSKKSVIVIYPFSHISVALFFSDMSALNRESLYDAAIPTFSHLYFTSASVNGDDSSQPTFPKGSTAPLQSELQRTIPGKWLSAAAAFLWPVSDVYSLFHRVVLHNLSQNAVDCKGCAKNNLIFFETMVK